MNLKEAENTDHFRNSALIPIFNNQPSKQPLHPGKSGTLGDVILLEKVEREGDDVACAL